MKPAKFTNHVNLGEHNYRVPGEPADNSDKHLLPAARKPANDSSQKDGTTHGLQHSRPNVAAIELAASSTV